MCEKPQQKCWGYFLSFKFKIMNIEAFFPLEIEVSQEVINNSDIKSCTHCIGAQLLRSILPEEYSDKIHWGYYAGSADDISIKSSVNMVNITNPIIVKLDLI